MAKTIDLETLRSLAQAAREVLGSDAEPSDSEHQVILDYASAATPDAVLALICALEMACQSAGDPRSVQTLTCLYCDARQVIGADVGREEVDTIIREHRASCAQHPDREVERLRGQLAEQRAAIERLRTGLNEVCDMAESECRTRAEYEQIAELRKEAHRLRKEAPRG
ncbi:MAG: hypothetical protein ACTHU0_18335 [Kofleriaceae bacterium]